MKFSISIPDELWLEAHEPGSPNSQTVQEALRLLADTKRPGLPGAAVSVYADGELRGELEAGIKALADEAREVRRIGYEVGLEVAVKMPWPDLERLPGGRPQLDEALFEEIYEAGEAGEALRTVLDSWGSEVAVVWDDEATEYIYSATFFDGMATAVTEVRSEVRRRLRNASDSGDDSKGSA